MSSAMKPVLPPTGGQTTTPNASPPKPLPPQNIPHNVPTSYTQPISHVPQNLGIPHSTNMTPNIMPNMAPQNNPPVNQAPALSIPSQISAPNKNAGLPTSRPNMIPFHPNSSDEGTTLPPSQNAAQLMAVHREQQMAFNKPQSNGTAPAQPEACNKSPTVPAPVEVRPEPPQVTTQNHIPESAKQPTEAPAPAPPTPPEKPAVPVPQPTNNTPPETSPSPTPAPVVPGPVSEAPKDPTPPAVAPPTAPTPEPATNEAVQPAQVTPPKPVQVIPKETATPPAKPPVATPTKPPTTMKLATTSPRVAQRQAAKREAAKVEESESESDEDSVKVTKAKQPAKVKGGRTSEDEKKNKRQRTRTQPYQSPLPELALITKLSSTPTPRTIDEKLIVFYKNEFLAVRNAEGGFYVCQAVQNVYKSSPRIKIRWLSQDKNDKTYIPDFYDVTDFDCILTNINMERIEKGKYNLPKEEEERTENILKRALAVESGDAAPSLTEEHPDGLDLSLFRDESQLKQKRKGTKRKASRHSHDSATPAKKKSPAKSKARKVSKPTRTTKTSQSTSYSVVTEKKKHVKSAIGRSERAKRRGEVSPISSTKSSPVVDQKKAKVLAKVAGKTAVPAQTNNKKKPVVKPTIVSKPTTSTASTSRSQKSTRSSGSAVSVAPTPTTSRNSTRSKKTRK